LFELNAGLSFWGGRFFGFEGGEGEGEHGRDWRGTGGGGGLGWLGVGKTDPGVGQWVVVLGGWREALTCRNRSVARVMGTRLFLSKFLQSRSDCRRLPAEMHAHLVCCLTIFVESEQLRILLGVPLLVGTRVPPLRSGHTAVRGERGFAEFQGFVGRGENVPVRQIVTALYDLGVAMALGDHAENPDGLWRQP